MPLGDAFKAATSGSTGRCGSDSARIARSTPSCFRANSRCDRRSSSAGPRSGGTASSSSSRVRRVTGRTRAGRAPDTAAAEHPAPGAHEGARSQRFSSHCSGSQIFCSPQQEKIHFTTNIKFFLNWVDYTTGAKSSARSSSSNRGPSLLCAAPPSRIEAARSALRACRSRIRSSTVPAHTSL